MGREGEGGGRTEGGEGGEGIRESGRERRKREGERGGKRDQDTVIKFLCSQKHHCPLPYLYMYINK